MGKFSVMTFFAKPVKLIHFQARSQSCEKRLLASSCFYVRLTARKEQLGFHWTDFHEM
jgi:hypothetical protein